MKYLFLIIFTFLYLSSCTIFKNNNNFDYFENDIADFYIPKYYKYIVANVKLTHPYYTPIYGYIGDTLSIKNEKYFDNLVFYYSDSSYFFIGRGYFGDLKVTELCCDTLFTAQNEIMYYPNGKLKYKTVSGSKFPIASDYDFEYYFETNDIDLYDWNFDNRDSTYRKQLIKSATDYWIGYFSAGYVCKRPQDTIKFNQTLKLINWKYKNLVKR